ncbi:MAG: glycosyltransferase family 4 protein [Verrucomicrobia bacterium]|nr:glycosyltransferase family 4 protein [Verrucomicrobiota bacterium]
MSAPVGRDAAGSVEAWTWLLARELSRAGHRVTVFGCGGSVVEGELVATLPGPYGAPGGLDDWQLCEWVNLCRAVEASARFDVLHAQAYLWGIPLQPFSRAPMVHTLHIAPDANAIRLWESAPGSRVTAISRHQWSGCPQLEPAAIIPHGLDIGQFPFRADPEDYVVYLGRFTSGKGSCQAVQAARAAGVRLVLAGPENAYFREKIKPWVDGRTVEYAGFVRGVDRARLLGGARALLYPVQYPEPFGLVLVEAMLCGTPVAALRVGAVPEILENGVSGYMASDAGELAGVISRCDGLDRRRIRDEAVRRFSAGRMARDYVRVYEAA